MANSLITGVSGLTSHQKMIEVVGNNLANLNTVGYKTRTAVFSDVLYETVRGASGGNEGVSGGTNPIQIGTGSRLSSININTSAGNLTSTGGDFDFAIDGGGYFVVNSETGILFSRAGSFQLDQSGQLVDAGTGLPVQRFGTVGESTGNGPSFQVAGNSNIFIPLGSNVPGEATEAITINGNLSSGGALPAQQALTTDPWLTGGSAASGSTLLNNLDFVTTPYQAGDSINIVGTDADGASISTSVAVDGSTTVNDVLAAFNSAYSGATATLGPDGSLQLQANDEGESFLSLSLEDAAGNVGGADFTQEPFLVTTEGASGAVQSGVTEVIDALGGAHTVNFQFERNMDGSWNLNAELAASDGTIVDGQIQGIKFDADGNFQTITGTGTGDSKLTFLFDGQTEPLTVDVDLGDGSGLIGTGLTSFAGAGSLATQQDGYPNGVLASVQVDTSGVILGIASNGLQFPIAQLAVASFKNPQGLVSTGNNMFSSSLNSGEVQLGTAGSGGNGVIRAGQLEQSNVDIAQEFTRLIIAQRGFSANARTITVTNQILEELTNLIR